MAGRLPKRTTSPGKGPVQKKAAKGPVVGYGDKGKAFHNQTKYNQSKSGQAHAANPNLSKKPVGYGKNGNAFFSAAKYEASKAGKASGGHLPGGAATRSRTRRCRATLRRIQPVTTARPRRGRSSQAPSARRG